MIRFEDLAVGDKFVDSFFKETFVKVCGNAASLVRLENSGTLFMFEANDEVQPVEKKHGQD